MTAVVCVSVRLLGVLTAHAMAHNPIHELPDLVTAAGFRLTGTGDRRPLLHWVAAPRPDTATDQP